MDINKLTAGTALNLIPTSPMKPKTSRRIIATKATIIKDANGLTTKGIMIKTKATNI